MKPASAGPGAASALGGAGASAAPAPKPGAASPGRRGGAIPAFAAGLIGVVVGAGLVYGYEAYAPGGEGESDARLAALEQHLDGLASRDALAGLDRRVAGLDTAVRPLPDAVKAAQAAAAEAAAKAEAAQQQAARAPAAAALPAVGPAGDLPARLTQIDQRVARLQDDLTARTTAANEGRATLDRRLSALDQALDGRVKANTEAEQGLGRRLEAQDRQVAGIGKSVADLAKSLSDRPDAAILEAGLKLGATNRIALALASGAPYADALAALRTLKVEDATLAPLARFADTGAPTVPALAQAFATEAQRISAVERSARARTAAASGSFTDRLASIAGSIVTVRRAGSAATEAAASDAAPVATALDRGDVVAAAAAYDALPETARTETAAFGARLKARAQAETALRGLASTALTRIPASGAAGGPAVR